MEEGEGDTDDGSDSALATLLGEPKNVVDLTFQEFEEYYSSSLEMLP